MGEVAVGGFGVVVGEGVEVVVVVGGGAPGGDFPVAVVGSGDLVGVCALLVEEVLQAFGVVDLDASDVAVGVEVAGVAGVVHADAAVFLPVDAVAGDVGAWVAGAEQECGFLVVAGVPVAAGDVAGGVVLVLGALAGGHAGFLGAGEVDAPVVLFHAAPEGHVLVGALVLEVGAEVERVGCGVAAGGVLGALRDGESDVFEAFVLHAAAHAGHVGAA